MTPPPSFSSLPDALETALQSLCLEIARAARRALDGAARAGSQELTEVQGQGAGDVTFVLDARIEAVCDRWFESQAELGPLSFFTEDRGWRHAGPKGALERFDHGGPRIVIDPIDGTRNLMHELRPAWSVVGVAGPGAELPSLSDLCFGMLTEIPLRGSDRRRVLSAHPGDHGCASEERAFPSDKRISQESLRVDEEARVDHGYFPFFRYGYKQRVALAQIESSFFERLVTHEKADGATFWDDQYISNGGQLAQLCYGRYRMIAELRAWLSQHAGLSGTTTKPYDCAGAIVCARAAGAVIETADGRAPLNFPLDANTPVSFVGWVNRATAKRLGPHLRAALSGARRNV